MVLADLDATARGLGDARRRSDRPSSCTPTSPTRLGRGVCAATVDRFGGVDILVNNAALYGDWDMGDNSYEYLRTVFDVNLHGVWLMSRAGRAAHGRAGGGRIVNQASGAAYNYAGAGPAQGFGGLGVVQLPADEVGRDRPHQVHGRPARSLEHHGELRSHRA